MAAHARAHAQVAVPGSDNFYTACITKCKLWNCRLTTTHFPCWYDYISLPNLARQERNVTLQLNNRQIKTLVIKCCISTLACVYYKTLAFYSQDFPNQTFGGGHESKTGNKRQMKSHCPCPLCSCWAVGRVILYLVFSTPWSAEKTPFQLYLRAAA